MLEPNTLLHDRYLIERKLGQGGMGAVYQAIDKRFDTTVALKETLVHDENLRKAFEREARLLNKLRHAALPHVIDFFAEGDGQFLVMQFIPGEDLAERLQKNGRPFPYQEVLSWGDQVLAALEYLHGHEPPVVHRDIKPQNIKLTPQGEVILLDFGLSKGSAVDSSATVGAGASVVGYTPHFAPLEQIRGAGTNPRSDLYSLAATLYLLLTGTPPPDALARASAMIGGRPDPMYPPHQVNPQIPPAVGEVLFKALAQSPENRWVSASALRKAFRDASQANPNTMPQRSPSTVPQHGPMPTNIPSGPGSVPSNPSGPGSVPSNPSAPGIMGPPPGWRPPVSNPQQQGQWGASMPQNAAMMPNSQPRMPNSGPGIGAYPSGPGGYGPGMGSPKSKVIPWTVFGIWAGLGPIISIFIAAVILVIFVFLFLGEDAEPPPALTLLLTGAVYLFVLGLLFIWAKR